MRIHSYPKIYNLGHPDIASLFDGTVYLQEKVDGSQFSFALLDGVTLMRSKGQDIYDSAQGGKIGSYQMFNVGIDAVLGLNLIPGWIYRGEYFQKPKHNALAYDRVPKSHIILFDVETSPQSFLSPLALHSESERIGLEHVPYFEWHTTATPLEQFERLLGETSVLGGQKLEGVVVKNYGRYGSDGKVLMGKHVSERFKEIHKTNWKTDNPTQTDIVDRIAQSLRTPARWDKAIQHLKEAGKLTESPRDIGPLLDELKDDVRAEEEARIKEALFKWAYPKIARTVSNGFPEYYKQKLLEQQFK